MRCWKCGNEGTTCDINMQQTGLCYRCQQAQQEETWKPYQVGWEMSDGNETYEEWMKCTGIFCDLCKKEIAKYEIALRRACASESPKFCCDCAIDLCEQELVRRSSSNPSRQDQAARKEP